jgi:hypothetical protein
MRRSLNSTFLMLVAVLLLAGCAGFGPPVLRLSASDIEARFEGVSSLTRQLEGLQVEGPKVGFLTASERVELAWTAHLPAGSTRLPLSARLAITGRPVLNAAGDGLELEDARIEDFSLRGLPFLNLSAGDANRGKAGDALGRLPLLSFDPAQLRRGDELYRAAGVQVNRWGLSVALVPR